MDDGCRPDGMGEFDVMEERGVTDEKAGETAEPTITFFGDDASQASHRITSSDALVSDEGSPVAKSLVPHGRSRAAVLIAFLVAAVVVGVSVFDTQMREATAAAYSEDIRSTVDFMDDGESEAREVCEKIRRIWQSAIFTSNRYLWDADIRQYYSTDFNTALSMYSGSYEYQTSKAVIENKAAAAKEAMQRVVEPPEAFEGSYDTLTDLYADFSTVVGLATHPTGNITSYTEACNEAFGDYRDDRNLVESQIPSSHQWD